MSGISVRPVKGRSDLKTWVRFPRKEVYGRSSLWVPPLDREVVRSLDPDKNPFFRHGEARALLATGAKGKTVGRILAHVYHRHNVRHGERAAFFGYFECLDSPEAARALAEAAAAFGLERGCEVLRGPFNMTAMQQMGVLLEGYEEAPAVDESYTAPYYPALLEGAGLRPVFPVSTFRLDRVSRADPDTLLEERHRELLAGGRLRIRAAELDDFDAEMETLRELLNDSFYDNPHFVPITRDEFRFQVADFKRAMDPAISLVAELDGVPCAFVVAVPDFNPLLKRMNGRLGPVGFLRYLLGRGRLRGACLLIMGVQRQLQGQGIIRLLHVELLRALRARGYDSLTITWIAHSNRASVGAVSALGARPLHTLTLYEARLPLVEVRG
jgi:GNAT superfamily N-acetyltransferase